MRRENSGGGEPNRPAVPLVAQKVPGSEEELSLVDSDIAATFRRIGNYVIGTPSVVQATREMRKLRESLDAARQAASPPMPGSMIVTHHDDRGFFARLFGVRRG